MPSYSGRDQRAGETDRITNQVEAVRVNLEKGAPQFID
jgi:hypothetical protein